MAPRMGIISGRIQGKPSIYPGVFFSPLSFFIDFFFISLSFPLLFHLRFFLNAESSIDSDLHGIYYIVDFSSSCHLDDDDDDDD